MRVQNPIIWADFPDPDVIRVGDTFYMVTTTMFVTPGGPILKSKDLCHWEIVSYIFDIIEDNDIYQLKNGKNAYGKGQWATSLKYYQGMYYACFVCNDMHRTYIYYTDDIEKSGWNRYVIEGIYHDMSFLFDNGKPYLIYNCGDVRIAELKDDLSGVKEGGINQLLFSTPSENMRLRCEGCRAYRINGYYYLLFIEWPSDGHGRRRVICYRSKDLLGEYERKILLDDDMGYHNQGIAQGAIIDTPDGKWYSILFQDHGAVGRIPYLLPVSWSNEWPVPGIDGKVPESFDIPFERYEAKPLIISDSFNHDEDKMDLRWQWNHNAERGCWSFVEHPGYLRLRTQSLAKDILSARNTLTQRTAGPKCAFTVELETEGMKAGDYAGLAAFQSNYGIVGVKADDSGSKRIVIAKKDSDVQQRDEEYALLAGECIFLKIAFDFENSRDMAMFYFSKDGIGWTKIGSNLHMLYTLDVFTGYRIGIFYYAEKEIGGYADFRNFRYEAV
ncbi:beta-xylosidase [Anaerobacterium chartisolvens]|uniref:Beta-xylosidase n=1 Tax=Anaerobacterium chartisolvens TaxID=1297424 RepID=A0A369AYS2_9FIRM|nr:glycoside hydrolase 43 family protein [Anaerobacterium chartisolvens]RCX13488.1 beta-xylosidase [Anaerobacterium chartisolvens]